MTRILFVCTGNTCRSPMAEGLLNKYAKARGLVIEVRSAGTAAVDGIPISGHTASILMEAGDATATPTSRCLSEELVQWADLILTMTMNHKKQVLQRHPSAIDKIHTLKEYASRADEQTEAILREMEQLTSDFAIKQATGEPIPPELQAKLFELEAKLPDFDIVDPFGGSIEAYRYSAMEIDEAIRRIVDQWKA